MTLTKANIAQKIADDCGFMKGEASEIIEKLLEIIKNCLIVGEGVMISGLGKWNVRSKDARRGRNPKTGEEMFLDARRVVTWKYSPVLKESVADFTRRVLGVDIQRCPVCREGRMHLIEQLPRSRGPPGHG